MPNLLQRFVATYDTNSPTKLGVIGKNNSNTGMGTNNINNSFRKGKYILYVAPSTPGTFTWETVAKPRIEDRSGPTHMTLTDAGGTF